jgi:hypothetical protein
MTGPPPKELPKWQECLFYEGKHTGLGEHINLNGYWYEIDRDTLAIGPIAPIYMFYDDGTCGELWINGDKTDKRLASGEEGVDFNSIFHDGEYWSLGSCYVYRNDTICVESYNLHPYWWYMTKLRFIVINRDTIELVAKRLYQEESIGEWESESRRYKFVPAHSIPDPDLVLIKRNKWIWRNRNDWKAYKSKMKNR